MGRKTNNGSIGPDERTGDAADRPFCVFYVDPVTPKAINAETVMAPCDDEARRLAREKHKHCTILYVRGVGAENDDAAPAPMERACNRHLPPLQGLPGARFIDGEFRATRNGDETELDAISD